MKQLVWMMGLALLANSAQAVELPRVFADGMVFEGEAKRQVYQKLIASEELNNIWMKAIRTPLLQTDDTDYAFYADNPHGEDLLQTLYL